MARPPRPALTVLQNNRAVGHLSKDTSGAIEFRYDPTWMAWEFAYPVSLSLQLREDPYRGAPVAAVFENLLPDSEPLRRRVAERVGATGSDAYGLLAAIGRDCVGAWQFVTADDRPADQSSSDINGEPIDDEAIGQLLANLDRAPLGLDQDDAFRISVAGAQEKTALLRYDGQWLKPHGTTPTTHIFKTPIGQLPNGIDLSHSVENEFYCLKLLDAFGLPTSRAEIRTFGRIKALVVERFDRQWSRDGRLLRLPQEDCCQALAVPPSRKYQNDGGPGIVRVAGLLKSGDKPQADLKTFFKAQILFWLIGATDGHAKNFSIFLRPGGGFSLTPLYDVLTAQPSLTAGQIQRRQMKLAMSLGTNNHYRIDEIHRRHFEQTAAMARLPASLLREVIEDVVGSAAAAIAKVEAALPDDFPMQIHDSVADGLSQRLKNLT